jgi:hypothetical protein
MRKNGELLSEHRDLVDFYAKCGQSELADIVFTREEFFMNKYDVEGDHWNVRLAQKFFLKPEKDPKKPENDPKHHMRLYSIGHNKLLFDLECESKSYTCKQSFILIDF